MNKGSDAEITVSFRLRKPVRQRLMEQARSRGMLLSAYLREYVEGAVYPRQDGSGGRRKNGRGGK